MASAPSAVMLPIFCSGGICSISSSCMGASATLLMMTSTARTFRVSSWIPMCSLGQLRRFGSPCLRAFALGFDAGAVDQEIERAIAALLQQAHIQCSIGLAQPHRGTVPNSLTTDKGDRTGPVVNIRSDLGGPILDGSDKARN